MAARTTSRSLLPLKRKSLPRLLVTEAKGVRRVRASYRTMPRAYLSSVNALNIIKMQSSLLAEALSLVTIRVTCYTEQHTEKNVESSILC